MSDRTAAEVKQWIRFMQTFLRLLDEREHAEHRRLGFILQEWQYE